MMRKKDTTKTFYPNSSFRRCVHTPMACCMLSAECCNAYKSWTPASKAAMQSNATNCSRIECQVQWHSRKTHTAASMYSLSIYLYYYTGAVRRRTFLGFLSSYECVHARETHSHCNAHRFLVFVCLLRTNTRRLNSIKRVERPRSVECLLSHSTNKLNRAKNRRQTWLDCSSFFSLFAEHFTHTNWANNFQMIFIFKFIYSSQCISTGFYLQCSSTGNPYHPIDVF